MRNSMASVTSEATFEPNLKLINEMLLRDSVMNAMED